MSLIFSLLIASHFGGQLDIDMSKHCSYSDGVLDRSFQDFDQDINGGWRELEKRPGCEQKAAELISAYRRRLQSYLPILSWHEGQLRAYVGDYSQAIKLMRSSRQSRRFDLFGWNLYVDATIAFLKRDKFTFDKNQVRLDKLRKPDFWPMTSEWPPNKTALARLSQCFGQPYKVAYVGKC